MCSLELTPCSSTTLRSLLGTEVWQCPAEICATGWEDPRGSPEGPELARDSPECGQELPIRSSSSYPHSCPWLCQGHCCFPRLRREQTHCALGSIRNHKGSVSLVSAGDVSEGSVHSRWNQFRLWSRVHHSQTYSATQSTLLQSK